MSIWASCRTRTGGPFFLLTERAVEGRSKRGACDALVFGSEMSTA